ncbi:non-POU domain-containing octamer-binding [Brachionus plicatilis]|uniref:Non-POU domain-containing octamer-binding n=1 Tax=Brachionus plicatilis TaxID=10195 RepID=A0A3M7SEF8_BRAPC|nr:non-POU domain-containing octamer-binding [Brachionus plicatilis]
MKPSESTYSLFGPSSSNQPGLLMIAPPTPASPQPLTDSTNLIKPPAKPAPTQSHPTDLKKLFVGNLPSNTTLDELIELFSKYGKVNRNLSVVKDDNYAFIHFYSEVDAELAHKELNDSLFKTRYIRVQYSVSQGHIKKSRTYDFKRMSSQQLSESSSHSSLSSSDNQFYRITQSQSVMSFHNTESIRPIGRPIRKSSQKPAQQNSGCYGLPVSHSLDEIGLHQVNLSNYIYLKSLLEQRTKLHQIDESSPSHLLNSFSCLNLNQF